ncbi:hypothetical protein M3M33_13630, partial [Loigolactobacillus coryniformis]|uniref:hypothetical protein n=1 Tax=Loigolactobacillus coryniformis TaxID=1610 RepID=UPI00201A93B8
MAENSFSASSQQVRISCPSRPRRFSAGNIALEYIVFPDRAEEYAIRSANRSERLQVVKKRVTSRASLSNNP